MSKKLLHERLDLNDLILLVDMLPAIILSLSDRRSTMTAVTYRQFWSNRITQLVTETPENSLHDLDGKAWGRPLVGIARGDDPLFQEYKQVIGDVHWTPVEALQIAYPKETFDPQNLRVICWILPQTKETLAEQRLQQKLPGRRWVLSRHYGEKFNEWLRITLRDEFRGCGIRATAPTLLSEWAYRQTPQAGLCSNWSERHAAYAAGLGTFGLSDGLITEAGKAVRIGSIIVACDMEPTARTATSHTANCLFYAQGTCGACIPRCPVAAISRHGHDKPACHDYIRTVTAPYAFEVCQQQVTPCGLCQTRIPCETRNPLRNGSKSSAAG